GKVDDRVLGRPFVVGAAQPGIDMTCRLLAVADSDCHGALARHHVAARKYARMAGHHVRRNGHRTIRLEPNFRNLSEKSSVGLLPERKDDGIGLQRLELPGWLRSASI